MGAGKDVQLQSGSRQGVRMGDELTRTEKYKDRKGNARERRAGPDIVLKVDVTSATSANITISYNGKTIKTRGTLGLRAAKPTGKGGVDINGSCKTTKRDLGLDSKAIPVTIGFFTPAR